MTYKKYLEDQFLFRDLDDCGYLMYSRMTNEFFYADHIMKLSIVVASYINNVLEIDNIGLLEKHIPGTLDEVVKEIAQECAQMDCSDEQRFTREVVDVCNRLHTIATIKQINRKK